MGFFIWVFIVGVFALVLYIVDRKQFEELRVIRKDIMSREAAMEQRVEESISNWLRTLQLPQLSDPKKLQESARQLRIVLVGKLLHWY